MSTAPTTEKRNILILLDSDPHPSVFDRVVAIDAGASASMAYGNVKLDQVQAMVHGAIFTRGPGELHRTAIFIGGSDVAAGEAMLRRAVDSFLGPLRVSVMMDANGANTTAAAAVLAARKHVDLSKATALLLGGTGPVGQRAARLLSREGATVLVASRSEQRAVAAAEAVNKAVGAGLVQGMAIADDEALRASLKGVTVVIAAGAAGVELLPLEVRREARDLKVVIDLNAVPPLGIEGVDIMDKAKERDGVIAYGAIGTGGAKMKIHRAAIASLFTSNDKVLDAEQIFELAKTLS